VQCNVTQSHELELVAGDSLALVSVRAARPDRWSITFWPQRLAAAFSLLLTVTSWRPSVRRCPLLVHLLELGQG
jgi:hypothetical protein